MSQATRRAAAAALALAAAAGVARAGTTFANPLAGGADPTVQLVNGTYYYSDTTGGDLMIGSGTTLPAAITSAMKDVYKMPSGTSNVWAPELKYNATAGVWDDYYSAQVNGVDHRMYVLQSTTSNPLGTWVSKGQITDSTNDWAIDGTTYTASSGTQYMIWSGWPGSTNVTQNLYIAPLSNAYTVGGSRSLISSPTNGWETQGGTPSVNEGPEVLTHNGTTTVIYSASGSWTDSYCLGELKLTAGADPTLASSWTKIGPVLSSANGVYGPGHCTFTTSDSGTRDWIVYHANVQSIASGGTVWNRNVRAQPYSWNPDGTPSFGQPVPVTVPIQWGPTSWVGAINEAANDSVHQYDNAANWVGNAVTDSFANVTLTDDTTLYLAGDHATAGDLTLTYGSGQKFLAFQSTTSAGHTFTLNGNVNLATLGGANSVYFSVPVRPLTLALNSAAPTFSLASNNSFYVDGPLTGSNGLTVTGGGSLVFRQGGKAVTGAVTVNAGSTLSAGDGSSTGVAGGNLAPTATYAVNGSLTLAGLSGAAETETVAGLSGTGTVAGTNAAGSTLVVAPSAASTFAGTLTGSALSVTAAGPAGLTLAGTSNYGGTTAVTGGSLDVTGTLSATAGLRLSGGSTTVDHEVDSAGFSSVGLNAGNVAALTVNGKLNVTDGLNVGDNGTGTMTVAPGSAVAVQTLFVAKYGAAVGTIAQTGGTVSTLAGGTDWQIGGAASSAAAAVGTYNLSGGSLADSNNLQVGAYGHGTLNLTGGGATVGGYLSIGRYPGATGIVNASAGTLTASTQTVAIVGEQGTGTLNVAGTAAIVAQQLSVGHNGGVGSVAQAGGSVAATAGVLLGRVAGGSGAYTLSGGTLTAASVTRGAGTGTFTFDGGTLSPTVDAAAFVQGLTSATVTANNGTINTAGRAVTIAQPFGGAGGLTKAGTGMLTLSGANTYASTTTVAAGTLALSPTGSVAGGLTVNGGGALTFAAGPAGGGVLVRSVGLLTVDAGGTAAVVAAATSDRTVLVATGLSLAGTLDLGDGDAIVRQGSLSALTAAAADGDADGTWAGSAGLLSSTAAADASHLSAWASSRTPPATPRSTRVSTASPPRPAMC